MQGEKFARFLEEPREVMRQLYELTIPGGYHCHHKIGGWFDVSSEELGEIDFGVLHYFVASPNSGKGLEATLVL